MHIKPEELLSQKIKMWLDRLNEIEAINTMHYTVPNEFLAESGKGFHVWQKKEAAGCVAGAPDWLVLSSSCHCLMELKDAKTMKAAIGKMSKAQKDFAITADRKGIKRYTVFDKDSFIHALRDSGMLKIN